MASFNSIVIQSQKNRMKILEKNFHKFTDLSHTLEYILYIAEYLKCKVLKRF